MTDQRVTPHVEELARLVPAQKLSKDLLLAARTISDAEARFLTDAYYSMQDARIRADGQVRSIVKNPVETGEVDPETGEVLRAVEPHDVLKWLSDQNSTLEAQIKRALEKYVGAHVVGEWLIGIHGIGPVISAGLLAHIDIHKAPTAGHIWRFAGLDPTVRWEKKTTRPWNAQLKVICWKAGESFIKFHNSEECFYGHLWKTRKEVYIARNEAGDYAARAAQILTERKVGKDTDAYKAYSVGRFPPAHIHAMARRYAVKIFLSHLHGEMYRRILKKEPPFPYVLEHLGHAHMIKPPG
jgi:hypothetical protein